MSRLIDLTGQRFGMLTVLCRSKQHHPCVYWTCRCDCGRIIEAAARRLKEPMEKFPMTIGQFGNTSTASIPLLLDDMIQKDMLKRGDKIIMSGFGAGMTWGAVLMEW